jgi:hypothetical protein
MPPASFPALAVTSPGPNAASTNHRRPRPTQATLDMADSFRVLSHAPEHQTASSPTWEEAAGSAQERN